MTNDLLFSKKVGNDIQGSCYPVSSKTKLSKYVFKMKNENCVYKNLQLMTDASHL